MLWNGNTPFRGPSENACAGISERDELTSHDLLAQSDLVLLVAEIRAAGGE
jgi:hypothetical protein